MEEHCHNHEEIKKGKKSEKNILIAFILNLSFSIFEILGGFFTNSIAILSDSIHDFADALSIGISYFLEKISKRKPDEKYTYGYMRYSILGAFITTMILFVGSSFVIYGGIRRIFNPVPIRYDGMILFAVVGVTVNFLAALCTREGNSLNQKAVNLHMLEDVLGWIVVLIGSILMKFTEIVYIDSIMSIMVAIFIFFHATSHFKEILDLFLAKTPSDISVKEVKEKTLATEGVVSVHHIHVWSMDGSNNYATMHVVTECENIGDLKKTIRHEMKELGIAHVTIETERTNEDCGCKECVVEDGDCSNCHHHHHHHHH